MGKKKSPPVIAELFVMYKEYRSGGEICSGQENDPWPSYEDTYIDLVLLGISKTRPKLNIYDIIDYEVVGVEPEVLLCNEVYLVYGRYTTGNTFGSTCGVLWIPPDAIFSNLEDAEKFKAKLENDESYNVPWNGYFDRFESVNIEKMELK